MHLTFSSYNPKLELAFRLASFISLLSSLNFPLGSFGVKEDDFFEMASLYAREHRVPRVYISCNSGARIGLVESLKPLFKVEACVRAFLLVVAHMLARLRTCFQNFFIELLVSAFLTHSCTSPLTQSCLSVLSLLNPPTPTGGVEGRGQPRCWLRVLVPGRIRLLGAARGHSGRAESRSWGRGIT